MNKKDKILIIKKIKKDINKYKYLYFIDISRFNSNLLNLFKRECYNNNIILKNVKNNLLKKILNKKISKILYGSTFLMFSNNINISAIIIKKYQISINNILYPIFKGAIIDSINFIDYELNDLIKLKSKNNIIFDIVNLLSNKIKDDLLRYHIYINNKILNILNELKKNKINNEKN
ncbi:MAG: 50S ribosomal protein L10 [Candidatus Shikimatogenerans bostrichidophilus]|nr:MAG: 50S ribosomal protein L10 [Candidatus Shikimatogenerans bostrichidophilus]